MKNTAKPAFQKPAEALQGSFFQHNCQKLLDQLEPESLALFASTPLNPPAYNPKYDWTPNTDFYYLTGLATHEAYLVLSKGQKDQTVEIFIPEYDALHEVWEGEILTPAKAALLSGQSEIKTTGHFLTSLKKSVTKAKSLYVQRFSPPIYGGVTAYARLIEEIRLQNPSLKLQDANTILNRLRFIKQPAEIELLQTAIDITIDSFCAMAKKIEAGMFEYQLDAELFYGYRTRGAKGHAFPPILGAGKNSCYLHYTNNASKLADGDVLLVDSGSNYQGYNADITRTFFVGKDFTSKAAFYYSLNLEVQTKVFEGLKKGMSFHDYFELCRHHQAEVLMREKLIKQAKDHKIFTIHNVGHSLGLDVHDAYAMDYRFEPGAVFTLEPGLYFPDEKIGIRVEDDILCTEQGFVNLSQAMPKSLEQLRAL